jgi:tRNA(fMet)-specific endonuclease VapC
LRLALDTNRYADFARDVAGARQVVESAAAVYLPFVVLAELRSGFLAGTRQRENEKGLRMFLSQPGVEVLYPDDYTTRHYANLHEQLRQQGTPMPISDLWIAALAVQHGLTLYARDKHFDYLPEIERI